MCRAFLQILDEHPQYYMYYPVHLNPNVKEQVEQELAGHPRLFLLPPLHYSAFPSLLQECYLVLSDSGGVHEEASFLGKPLLILREETERPEVVQAGSARLVGTNPSQIAAAARQLVSDGEAYRRMGRPRTLYGTGQASRRIAAVLLGETPRGRLP